MNFESFAKKHSGAIADLQTKCIAWEIQSNKAKAMYKIGIAYLYAHIVDEKMPKNKRVDALDFCGTALTTQCWILSSKVDPDIVRPEWQTLEKISKQKKSKMFTDVSKLDLAKINGSSTFIEDCEKHVKNWSDFIKQYKPEADPGMATDEPEEKQGYPEPGTAEKARPKRNAANKKISYVDDSATESKSVSTPKPKEPKEAKEIVEERKDDVDTTKVKSTLAKVVVLDSCFSCQIPFFEMDPRITIYYHVACSNLVCSGCTETVVNPCCEEPFDLE